MSKNDPKGGSTKTVSRPGNPFSSATDPLGLGLGLGVDALFNAPEQFSTVRLDAITVKAQIRETFEVEGNTLADLAASIQARGVLQPVLLRPTADGLELIAGERRYRAAQLAGLESIPAYIREMDDEEAEDAQMAENIHRLNLTQIEEAKKIQRDLDTLGSVDAVLAKYQKSASWLSKHLALLRLPEQARRLVTENVSADVEVINTVRTIEKVDPAAARALVEELKGTKGQESARARANAVKDAVKPTRKARQAVAPVGADARGQPPRSPSDDAASTLLGDVWVRLAREEALPKDVLQGLSGAQRTALTAELQSAFADGQACKDVASATFQGLRAGRYTAEGAGAVRLSAFLHGTRGGGAIKLPAVLASLRR